MAACTFNFMRHMPSVLKDSVHLCCRCFLAAYISFVAFVYEFLAWKRWAPIYTTATGRPNSILRSVLLFSPTLCRAFACI